MQSVRKGISLVEGVVEVIIIGDFLLQKSCEKSPLGIMKISPLTYNHIKS